MKEGFWVGLFVGIILISIVNIFIVWGGQPRGLFWRIEDNKQELRLIKKEFLDVISNHIRLSDYRFIKLENKRWYGR